MIWYLSFADDAGWLGYALVEATCFASAVAKSRMLGISRGEEVHGAPLEELSGGIEPQPRGELDRFIPAADAGEVVKWPDGKNAGALYFTAWCGEFATAIRRRFTVMPASRRRRRSKDDRSEDLRAKNDRTLTKDKSGTNQV